MRLLHKSEGCLLPGECDESDKDAMLKRVGGGKGGLQTLFGSKVGGR